MPDHIKNQIDELQNDIEASPKDQKASFMHGIAAGLGLVAFMAKEAGCDLSTNADFQEFVGYLVHHTPPLKKRTGAGQKPRPARDQLADDIRELLRLAIAGRLRIPKPTFDTSLEAEELVNRCLLTVVAIANRSALDDAIQDLRIMRSIAGGVVDRETVKAEVESCYEKFRVEIAAVERFNEMTKRESFQPRDVWSYLRANVQVDYGYDDEGELDEIDARYAG